MSFVCELVIGAYRPGRVKSPLRFVKETQAAEFGRVMFEPPQSVESWKVIPDPESANAVFVDGVVRML